MSCQGASLLWHRCLVEGPQAMIQLPLSTAAMLDSCADFQVYSIESVLSEEEKTTEQNHRGERNQQPLINIKIKLKLKILKFQNVCQGKEHKN